MNPRTLNVFYRLITRWFLSSHIQDAAFKYGATTARMAEKIKAAYDRWMDHPGAFAAIAFGQAVAVKP
ncbi:MAG: hypothetical protein OXL97_01170 [Chloroflexota bacterium]|nr:hypothetical protein [Chloroflexota bacterium]MDE2884343.1 hypothetical protein [Chloroflexota bacterium]